MGCEPARGGREFAVDAPGMKSNMRTRFRKIASTAAAIVSSLMRATVHRQDPSGLAEEHRLSGRVVRQLVEIAAVGCDGVKVLAPKGVPTHHGKGIGVRCPLPRFGSTEPFVAP